MNRLKKKYLISSSTQTQTQTDKKDKKLLKNRILSYQDIRLNASKIKYNLLTEYFISKFC